VLKLYTVMFRLVFAIRYNHIVCNWYLHFYFFLSFFFFYLWILYHWLFIVTMGGQRWWAIAFLVARLHCLVLYDNIVFVFLANKYSPPPLSLTALQRWFLRAVVRTGSMFPYCPSHGRHGVEFFLTYAYILLWRVNKDWLIERYSANYEPKI